VDRFLERERAALDELLPTLDRRLADVPLEDLERHGSPALGAFRDTGGPALLVPTEHKGIGADPVSAVRVQRAIGARAPSLAVAATMHHFSVASLVEASQHGAGFEWMLLEAIATQRLLVASGFAEGRTGQPILAPGMRAWRQGDKVVITGSKKPCSLSRSMDLLTVSVELPGENGEPPQLAVALVPRATPGLQVRPFWNSFVLAGAESDEVVLEDVEVGMDLVVTTRSTPQRPLDELQTAGFLWFELLMTASYLGVASALAARVLDGGKAGAELRAGLVVELEAAMLAVESVAAAMHQPGAATDEALFARALVARYSAQDAIARAVRRAVESLGGMAYIGSSDVAYLAAASAALAFHPPSRARMASPLCDYYAGQPLRVP
jgi:alkylation response protein AidB-like acyl-CoA dehydrogenase